MVPTLQPGDVLLVEKLTPRLGMVSRTDDLIFFEPPDALQSIVREREAAAAEREAAERAAAEHFDMRVVHGPALRPLGAAAIACTCSTVAYSAPACCTGLHAATAYFVQQPVPRLHLPDVQRRADMQ